MPESAPLSRQTPQQRIVALCGSLRGRRVHVDSLPGLIFGKQSLPDLVDAPNLSIKGQPLLVGAETRLSQERIGYLSRQGFGIYDGRSASDALIGTAPAFIFGVIQAWILFSKQEPKNGIPKPLLIAGETGTGKDVLAEWLQAIGTRQDKPFVTVDCGALHHGDIFLSELFGHVKGAFTGAHCNRQGAFAAANGGTVLIDEIGELPREAQLRLLTVIEKGVVASLGNGAEKKQVNVQILATTNKDLPAEVEKGNFRRDLLARLGGAPIVMPPLAARPGDIPVLAETFLNSNGQGLLTFSQEAIDYLASYSWPGNIRELSHTIARGQAFAQATQSQEIEKDWLTLEQAEQPGIGQNDAQFVIPKSKLFTVLPELKKRAIKWALEQTNGNRRRAADLLGINRTTLTERIRTLGPANFPPRRSS
jgi:DNA-binding NtrC family response regulator